MKIATLIAISATIFGLGVAPALAGEITGNGKATAAPDNANSICAFSGLNDDPELPPVGRVQNWGHTMLFFDLNPKDFNPGDACNPHAED